MGNIGIVYKCEIQNIYNILCTFQCSRRMPTGIFAIFIPYENTSAGAGCC